MGKGLDRAGWKPEGFIIICTSADSLCNLGVNPFNGVPQFSCSIYNHRALTGFCSNNIPTRKVIKTEPRFPLNLPQKVLLSSDASSPMLYFGALSQLPSGPAQLFARASTHMEHMLASKNASPPRLRMETSLLS